MPLTRSLATWFSDYSSQDSAGSKLRATRIEPLLKLIESFSADHDEVHVVDIGGSDTYWGIVPRQFLIDHRVRITIVNVPGSRLPSAHGPFTFVEADGCKLEGFADRAFHIAHSNSVVEHVGDWSRMREFAKELQRVSQTYFVQTPNYWFPIEPHFMTPFFHWLPKPMRVWLVRKFSLGTFPKASTVDEAMVFVEHARLLNREMFSFLFKGAEVSTERFFGLPKSFVALKK
jgi:hypothetical protein